MKNKTNSTQVPNLAHRILFAWLLVAAAFTARAEGDFALSSDELQRLLGPTLSSARIQLSSTSGFINVQLPNGFWISRPVSVPPFEAGPMTCTLQPIENAGPPTFAYRVGLFRFSLRLRPVSGNLLVRTSSIWPNVTATTVQIDVSFRLGLSNGSVVAEGLSTVVTGNIDLTGIAAPFSPIVRPEICQRMAAQVQSQLLPNLNLALMAIVPIHLAQATGYGATLRISGPIRHEASRVVFTVTGQNQSAPRTQIALTGIDPALVNPDALRSAPSWQGTQYTLKMPTSFPPGTLTPLLGTTLGAKANFSDNTWSFRVLKQELWEKGGTGVAISLELSNLSKTKRTLLDAGFLPSPTLNDANGNPAPQVDSKDAAANVFGRVFGPGETATVVLYFYYPSGVSAQKIAPEVLTLPHTNKSASITLRVK